MSHSTNWEPQGVLLKQVIQDGIKPNEANVLSEDCLLVMPNQRRVGKRKGGRRRKNNWEGKREEREKKCVLPPELHQCPCGHIMGSVHTPCQGAHAAPGQAQLHRYSSCGHRTGHEVCGDWAGGSEPWTGLCQGLW